MATTTMRAVPGSAVGPEYDTFLYASMGIDLNGMPVSVLSGLARSDVDPWQEAARLAGLPGKSAIERLAGLIETLPGKAVPDKALSDRPVSDKAWRQSEARTVATRLIALLPRTPPDNPALSEKPDSLGAMMNSRPWWVYVVLLSVVLGSQLLIAIHPPPPAPQTNDVHTAGEAAPPITNIGQ